MNKRDWLDITEYIFLGFLLLRTLLTVFTGNSVYLAIPLSLSMVLAVLVKRQNHQDEITKIDQLNQVMHLSKFTKTSNNSWTISINA